VQFGLVDHLIFVFQEMVWLLKNKTLRWRFVGSFEPPQVVQMRVGQGIAKDDNYAQITVRFFTQQVRSLYSTYWLLKLFNPLLKDLFVGNNSNDRHTVCFCSTSQSASTVSQSTVTDCSISKTV
jgi:hypothetical protein